MGLRNPGRVNIVITNRVLRYCFHKDESLESLVSHGEIELPVDTIKDGRIGNKPVLLKLLRNLVHEQKWKRKKLYFCVPDDTVVIRKIKVPSALSFNEVKGYVTTHLGNRFHLPFRNPAMDIELLKAGKEEQTILMFAYPKEKLDEFVSVFTEAGMKAVVADLTSLSVYRYYYLQEENKDNDNDNDVLLIHWNVDSLVLTTFSNHQAVFTRSRKLVLESGITNELITEITRIIDFYQFNITNGASTITRLLISGDAANLQEIKTKIQNSVTIPIDLIDELHKTYDIAAKYTDVLGLAMKHNV
ncbi:pilus assembly protein PilM [Virgibacillus phasianinus]|uniref:Pilus assembly protein PilM n=1 Tax=Virgibacillus phasianinus TaxID=2017483 RepID=A0A220U478_9BACI|nr:pilus assembly protein PilM [Virgibacillus phasianinus]ASK62968.1 pilus assembly protein PilM [Virgibacillus phasianinus]